MILAILTHSISVLMVAHCTLDIHPLESLAIRHLRQQLSKPAQPFWFSCSSNVSMVQKTTTFFELWRHSVSLIPASRQVRTLVLWHGRRNVSHIIRPFSYLVFGVVGLLEPIPAVSGRRRGDSRGQCGDKHSHSHCWSIF